MYITRGSASIGRVFYESDQLRWSHATNCTHRDLTHRFLSPTSPQQLGFRLCTAVTHAPTILHAHSSICRQHQTPLNDSAGIHLSFATFRYQEHLFVIR